MRRAFQDSVNEGQLAIVERIDVLPRQERRTALPDGFTDGVIGKWLRASVAADGALWRHQSLALAEIDEGSNVVSDAHRNGFWLQILDADETCKFLLRFIRCIAIKPVKKCKGPSRVNEWLA
jgi:hypothetical protein